MNQMLINASDDIRDTQVVDSGITALCVISRHLKVPADLVQLKRELALGQRPACTDDILRASKKLGLKARAVRAKGASRWSGLPAPAIAKARDGRYLIYNGHGSNGNFHFTDPVTRISTQLSDQALDSTIHQEVVLVGKNLRGGQAGADFGFKWFLPSIWRYRYPLLHVLLASIFIQMFALGTPIFFQVVVDKVLSHRSYSTLLVLVVGLVTLGFFDVLLQYLRTYVLTHTTNRIDVELGRRLFNHLLRLPLSYFETRPAGQTVARVRELETIRAFLTGQGLFSLIDMLFTLIFIAVLWSYSWELTLIVLGAIPFYIAITMMIRPLLREKIKEKFNKGAESQQFLVEAIIGAQTIKASAVEPAIQMQWEERLASYIGISFDAGMLAAAGQNLMLYVNKLTMAAILLFGAKAVMDGELTIGELVAFNMLSAQVVQPILRLSQIWQDFQQVQTSVARLGDILNSPVEYAPASPLTLPTPKGRIEIDKVTFGYNRGSEDVLKRVSIEVEAGEIIGIIGPSGCGKSTLTKLLQRLYSPREGQIRIDGVDISQVNPGWLRSHIGIVLQENLLFNRSIHDNIALANPAIARADVMGVARLSGAYDFITKLPMGFDTIVEERGGNLSGGQRQRLAIARAIVTNPAILILDEATSALDYESESIIHENMRMIARGRTVIIIAHRLQAVRMCDRIIGLEEGRVVESGAPKELLRNPNGLYARLTRLQAGSHSLEEGQ